MSLPAWLVKPTLRSWNRLLEVKTNHKSLFRETFNSPEQIFPPIEGDTGIWSDDPNLIRVRTELSDALTDMFPASIDDEGFGGPDAIVNDFLSIRAQPGWKMNPMTIPLVSNRILAKELNLCTGFLNERDERIFKELHKYMFRTVVPASMAMRKTASSGAPYFEANLVTKKKALAVFNEFSEDILLRFSAGKLEHLFETYGLFFGTYMGVRQQPDTVVKDEGRYRAKPREVADAEYARSGGERGRRFPADRTVRRVDGSVVDGIFGMRRRSVYAYPAAYNYWLTQFFTPLRAHYLNDGAFTFKHRGGAEIAEKLSPYASIRGFDVKQFDQSVQPWLLDEFVKAFEGFLREDVVYFLHRVLRQPIYQPHPAVVNASGTDLPLPQFDPFFGDPFDIGSFTLEVGLPSGIGPNPDIGKFLMTWAYLCLYDRHFHDVLEVGVARIIHGAHDRYALLNSADDGVAASNDPSCWATFETTLAEPFYFRIEKEEGTSFLGNVLYRDATGRLRAAPNVMTFVRNRLCPEHGVQHWSRRDFAGSGWYEGKKHYSSAPRYNDVLTVWDEIHRKHLGKGIDHRWKTKLEQERHHGVPILDEASWAVLENPDKIYYRYSIEEIDPWVLDKVVAAVPFDTYFPSIERYFV